MHWVSWSTCGFLVLGLLVVAPSCGSSSKNSGFGSDDGGGSGSGGGGGSGSSSGFQQFGDASGDGSACGPHCSSDLHSVIDCNGNVITMCPANQGCSGNTCVDACQSASDNKSTIGCEYYAVDPDIIAEGDGGCFAMFIANTWTSPVNVTADWNGQTINVGSSAYVPSGTGQSITYTPLGGGAIQPGQVAILFLDYWNSGTPAEAPYLSFACPQGLNAGITVDGAVHGTAIGHAFHVKTDRPVVAYDIFPYGGGQSAATSATLLVPTSAWDVNYIAVNAYQKDQLVPAAQPFLEVVASQANTTVSISPTAAIVAGTGVAATPQGMTGKYTLAAPGDYVQFTQDAELTGSPILADKPVGVWGGATCLNIDPGIAACDSAHQQLFPVKTLGNEYVAVRYPDRFTGMAESTPWRFVGAVTGTTLTYEPATPAGAPTSLNVGQVATFKSIAPFVVRSQDAQHPFYVSAHMTGGCTVTDCSSPNADGRGDPEFVNIIPPPEFLSSYVFFTDPTYPETHLVVTRTKGPNGFADVSLDCMGNLTGWLPVGSAGQYEYAQIAISSGNFQGQNGCDNGRHEIKSTLPFGMTVWGWGSAATGALDPNSGMLLSGVYSQFVSYAYPAGASVQPINTVIVPPGAQ